MNPIFLKNDTFQATFDPERGMNLLSYKRKEIEVIDPSTRSLFEERYAGLGALIGPHFHHRKTVPPVKDEALFPHIERVKAKGVQEPFSHGIARYAPWQVESSSSTHVKARLTGKDSWNGVPLAALEGQNFTMDFQAQLLETGLQINLSVVSDTDSLVGLHYYYHLPKGKGSVSAQVQNHYIEGGERKSLPSHFLTLELDGTAYDRTLFPFPDPLQGKIYLHAGSYQLKVSYSCSCQENAWQLYHPAGASYVCIEPLSSQDPRHPNLTVSSLSILLEILKETI